MRYTFETTVPRYGKDRGWGFADATEAMPPRRVDSGRLYAASGIVWSPGEENGRFRSYKKGATDYDLGGMLFRADLPRGAYEISVECALAPGCMGACGDYMQIAVSGMNPESLQSYEFWDAAQLVRNRHRASWNGAVWTFSFVNSRGFLEIEAEPLHPGTAIGIRSISVREIPVKPGGGRTIYILGDSTAKSYLFEEAPMSGWGQCFFRLTEPGNVRVINYSNGGRSLKTMYTEGRLNDLLLNGKEGDFVLLQSGHNDERSRNDGENPDGERIRFGGGSTEEMYGRFLTEIFLPAIRVRGMHPVLVTPVTRIDGSCADDAAFADSFTGRRFPAVMRRAAKDTNTPLLDLNRKSVEYFNEIGGLAAKAVVIAVEPGESPGKTNSGSYANGNPMNHPDGTHYKEALSHQYCRMAAEEIGRLKGRYESAALLYGLLSAETKEALRENDFSRVFPEVCRDTEAGRGAYYRNQIEKLVQLGVFQKDRDGCFHPKEPCTERIFAEGLQRLWGLPADFGASCGEKTLLRKIAARILYDAYALRFGFGEENKPAYMTRYNDVTISPDDPNYDANIPIGKTAYYPLVSAEHLRDLDGLDRRTAEKIREVYRLGLMRSERGIRRGSLKNGEYFEPEEAVSREKAAKLLYFCFILGQDVRAENHRIKKEEET